MSNEILNNLLREYEQKKFKAELDLEKRKELLYTQYPRLQEIDNELNLFAIQTAKNILQNASTSLLDLNIKVTELKKEKENILNKEKIPQNFLKPYYECSICKDTGYITQPHSKTIMCNCLKQKLLNNLYNKSNISNIDKENFYTFNENLFSDEVDLAKYKFNISPKKNILSIKNKCIEFINNFDNPNQKNLLFSGNTGLGKTFMSNSIANELIKKGKTVLYQTAPILLETIIDNKFNKYKTENSDDFYKSVLETDLLIIDDLGTECINSMKLTELFTIINTRLLNQNNKTTKTIISTNLTIENIFNLYEERIGSRIAGYYEICYFFGNDLRMRTR